MPRAGFHKAAPKDSAHTRVRGFMGFFIGTAHSNRSVDRSLSEPRYETRPIRLIIFAHGSLLRAEEIKSKKVCRTFLDIHIGRQPRDYRRLFIQVGLLFALTVVAMIMSRIHKCP